MTYLVLARKWRPRSFDTLVGQDHVVRALTHALETQRLHHAWLFTGTRGVGKTTLSRILAKSLNCEQGITAHPCGKCRACTEIDAGRYVDYVELDAASNRGVDEMTQLLEQAVYAPSSARFKVYMIDEVHMLTGHAFNAMLKTLEEPPPHVKFILATTDPQKIPVTVLSRCLQFNLKHMTVDAIVRHLESVLAEEGLTFEVPALRLLAQSAGGSMRDALSLTDQAIAYSAGNLSAEAVQGMLGTIDQRHLVRLVQALAAGLAADVLAVADELASRGLSYSGALGDLAVLLSHIAIQQRVPDALPAQDLLAEDIASLASTLHPDLVQLYYSVAVHSRSELSLAPDEYAGFVMACLRMLSLTPAASGEQPPPSGGERAVVEAAASASGPSVSGAFPSGPAASAKPAPAPASVDAPVGAAAATSGSVATPVDEGPEVPAWEAMPDHAPHGDDAAPRAAVSPEAAEAPAVREAAEETRVSEVANVPAAPTAADGAGSDASAPETPSDTELDTRAPETDTARDTRAPDTEPDAPQHSAPDNDTVPPDAEYDVGMPTDFTEDDAGTYPDDEGWEPVLGDEGPSVAAMPLPDLPRESDPKERTPRLAKMTPEDWPALAASLPVTGWAAQLARQAEWVGVEGTVVTLRAAIHSLSAKQGLPRLRTVLSEHFGKAIDLRIQFGATGSATAHAVEVQRRAQRQKEAEAAVANDPIVRSLIEEFGARVMPGSIMALDDERVA